jgi:hypothetical protein
MEAIEKKIGSALLGERFFIMAQIGAIALLLAAFKPLFPAYLGIALAALIITIIWTMWRGATKTAKYVMAILVLAMGLFLLVNTLTMLVVPAVLVEGQETLAGLGAIVAGGGNLTSLQTFGGLLAVTELTMPIIAMLIGGIVNLLFIVAGIFGIMSVHLM